MNVFDTIPFEDLIRYAIAFVVFASALIAIAYTIWGWFLIIISAGAEEKVKKAINHIRHALIGIVALILIVFVTPLLMTALGIEYGEYVRPRMIFDTISEVSQRIFWANTSIDSDFPDNNSSISPGFSDL